MDERLRNLESQLGELLTEVKRLQVPEPERRRRGPTERPLSDLHLSASPTSPV